MLWFSNMHLSRDAVDNLYELAWDLLDAYKAGMPALVIEERASALFDALERAAPVFDPGPVSRVFLRIFFFTLSSAFFLFLSLPLFFLPLSFTTPRYKHSTR